MVNIHKKSRKFFLDRRHRRCFVESIDKIISKVLIEEKNCYNGEERREKAMAIPVNIEDLINKRVVESTRIEFKSDWNPNPIVGYPLSYNFRIWHRTMQ